MYKVVNIKEDFTAFEYETPAECINWVSQVLRAVNNSSLLDELNRMQQQANVKIGIAPHVTDNVFANKFDIPPYFINLVIKDFGLKIVEEKS